METEKQLRGIRLELQKKFGVSAMKFREMDQVKRRFLYLAVQKDYFIPLTRIEELVNRAFNIEYAN